MLLLFDGVCNLCNGFVQWVIVRDKKGVFKFAALQSETGQQELKKLGKNTETFDSVVLIAGSKVLTQSDAAIEVAAQLGGIWSLTPMLRVFPRFLRNAVYNWVARNRYRWFGKREQCMLPRPEWKDRFLT
jgi:predicted DCC family thiol-disulfide oxidoreductase YuxK